MSKYVVIAGALLATVASAFPAQADPVSYNLNFQNNNTQIATSTGAGNTLSFSDTVSNSTLTATASAWNATKGTNGSYTITKATLGQYVGGLGVTSVNDDLPGSSCTAGGCGTHQVDNFGNTANSSSIDFIALSFNQAVSLGTLSRYSFSTYNAALTAYVYDADMSYGKGGTIANNGVMTDAAFSALFGTNVGDNGACATGAQNGYCLYSSVLGTAAGASAANASTTWFVAASLLSNYGGDGAVDSFKIANLTAYVTPKTPTGNQGAVPEPASWAMMVLGFGAAGTAIRRSRRSLALRSA